MFPRSIAGRARPAPFRQFEDPDVKNDGFFILGTDCEWEGKTFFDGQLRSIQFAWSEREAVVIEFRDENNEWSFQIDDEITNDPFEMEITFPSALYPGSTTTETCESVDVAEQKIQAINEGDPPDAVRWANERALKWAKRKAFGKLEDDVPEEFERKRYAYVGSIIGEFTDDPEVRFIGHHFAADSPWMAYWLKLKVLDRCILDTEFAQQSVDESSELSLERGIAMKYTTLGLYNLDLSIWKRANKPKWSNGYGQVPSEILLPYSALDVITPMRAYGQIRHQLEVQMLWTYYQKILNPFVTTVFHEFHMIGLPMDMQRLSDMRELYHFVRDRLDVKFKERVHQEAQMTLMERLFKLRPIGLTSQQQPPVMELYTKMQEAGSPLEAVNMVKPYLETTEVQPWLKLCQHIYDAPTFNIRSPDQMRTWLFEVRELTPIKSTNQKAKGLPSMDWQKVLDLPPGRQKLYTPAVDKQTLQILSEELPVLDELLNLNAVGNICKAFLKKAEVSVDNITGETVSAEQGLAAWVSSDNSLRYNFSLLLHRAGLLVPGWTLGSSGEISEASAS